MISVPGGRKPDAFCSRSPVVLATERACSQGVPRHLNNVHVLLQGPLPDGMAGSGGCLRPELATILSPLLASSATSSVMLGPYVGMADDASRV
jgi:hypothetical protein